MTMSASFNYLPVSSNPRETKSSQLFDGAAVRASFPWKNFVIAVLLSFNIIQSCILLRPWTARDQSPANWAKVETLPSKWVKFRWHTPWGSDNDTEANALWNGISTAHGHIAVRHDWAAEQNWPKSMPIPGQPDKGLYLLQSYHQLHCLRIIRQTLLESASGLPLTRPVHHSRHCFDAIRQFVQCHADNTPLYSLGDHTSGDGQLHQCKDWGALRDYASENSACFRDAEPGQKLTLEEHFGYCDSGSDGLPIPDK